MHLKASLHVPGTVLQTTEIKKKKKKKIAPISGKFQTSGKTNEKQWVQLLYTRTLLEVYEVQCDRVWKCKYRTASGDSLGGRLQTGGNAWVASEERQNFLQAKSPGENILLQGEECDQGCVTESENCVFAE